jgi:hypothetical protein
VLSDFFNFLRSRSPVVHLAFVPAFEGVEMPEKEKAKDAPMVYIDILSDHPNTALEINEWGVRFGITRSHPGAQVKVPWEAITLLANDTGFSWKNDPLLQAMTFRAAAAAAAPAASKFVH